MQDVPLYHIEYLNVIFSYSLQWIKHSVKSTVKVLSNNNIKISS
nr:MAG TPA: hypothetical protein [Caudoviricetes sp.]